MLYQIQRKYKSKNIGLQRDDGLSVLKSIYDLFDLYEESFMILVRVKRLANCYVM